MPEATERDKPDKSPKRKVETMDRISRVCISALIAGALCLAAGCTGTEEAAQPGDAATDGAASEADQESPTPRETLDSFIAALNGVSPLGFTEAETFYPDEEYRDNGPRSRVEYRLSAYNGSVAAAGPYGQTTELEVVSCGGMFGNSVRVYATLGSAEERDQLIRDLVAVFNTDDTPDEVEAVIAKVNEGGWVYLDGLDLNGYVNGDEFMAELASSLHAEPLYAV